MATIEIDFEVFKQLTMRRKTESVSCNDVLRELLGLGSAEFVVGAPEAASPGGWTTKGVTFPEGTEFRSTYKGKQIHGKVHGGLLVVNGQSFNSPSSAACSLTGTSVNGWIFWECRFPGATEWQLLKTLKK